MAEKTVKRVVTHPKLYMSVGGKLQHVKPGTELTLTESEATRLAKKVADPASTKKLVEGELVDGGGTESEAIVALTVELKAAKAETAAAAKSLTADNAKLNAAKAEIGKLTEALKATGAQLTALQKAAKK